MHDPETHLIPLVFQAIDGGRPLQVFGKDYPTPDGTCVRDYIHVADLADAHVKALDYLIDGGASIAMNLGTGQGHSVKEVISVAEAVTGRKVPHSIVGRREGDPAILVADPALAGGFWIGIRSILIWIALSVPPGNGTPKIQKLAGVKASRVTVRRMTPVASSSRRAL